MDYDLIFKDVPDKRQYPNTTSRQFKLDILEFAKDNGKDYTVLEVGTNHGHTTRILSFAFKNVITLDLHNSNLDRAKKLNKDRDNITYIKKDVYLEHWWDLTLPPFQVVFIDCGHQYHQVISDTHNSQIHCGGDELYYIYDDYGNPRQQVKKAVDDLLQNSPALQPLSGIGEDKGAQLFPDNKDLKLIDTEGIICQLKVQ